MNLGEIKIQALMLMYPDASVKYDDSTGQGIENAVYELKCNPNFEGLLEACVGSINRAFSQIEAMELSGVKCVDKAHSLCKRAPDGRVIIETEKDFLSLHRLYCHVGDNTYPCTYELMDNHIYADKVGQVYTVVYRTKIPRITRTTKESLEIELPNGICEAIPYFVMAELLGKEDGDRAREARELFEKMISQQEKSQPCCHQCFQIVYSME